jgi:DNA-binding response OmpR family regulator
MAQSRILVVEDDAAIRRGLVDALRFAGYLVLDAAAGDEALERINAESFDLVLLDVLLPRVDGFTILERVRTTHPTLPIIMVTARGAEDDRVRGLLQGADDYVVKPFSARELLARVAAVLRRAPQHSASLHALLAGGRRVDLQRHLVRLANGEERRLTEREVGILRHLAAIAPRAAGRDELLQRVWGVAPQGVQTRTVDMHIARLREKLGGGDSYATHNSATAEIILTVRGKGYRLADEVEREQP